MPPIELDFEALGLSEEQINAINSAHDKGIDGLKNKNNELLGKLKTLKDGGGGDSAELEALRQFKQKADQDAEAAKGNYQEALRLSEEKHAKTIEQLQAQNQTLNGNLEKILIDNGLSGALDEVKVKPEFKAAVTAMLRSGVELKEGAAMVGDKALADHIKDWAQSEQGKAFVAAPDNSGGGANGGSNNHNGTKNPWAKDSLNLTEQARIHKEDPQLAAQLKAAAGKA